MPHYTALPVNVVALRFDGTNESLEPFIKNSYAFSQLAEDVPNRPDMRRIVISTPSSPATYAYTGDYVVRHAFPFNHFEVYGPDEFARRFTLAAWAQIAEKP